MEAYGSLWKPMEANRNDAMLSFNPIVESVADRVLLELLELF
ncbi:MAG: hypothetical protein ACI883_001476 [Candidatus Azotimanducaceae bacterium]|jgi:hypothetical protein|tara:strand:- start:36 stop:161 length:126 start_codon:yes stop_codon:yes gene_type:complete